MLAANNSDESIISFVVCAFALVAQGVAAFCRGSYSTADEVIE